jgi:hypothetical protein
MGIEFEKPVRLHGETHEEYIMRYGESALRNMRAITARIDKMPLLASPTTAGPKPRPVTNIERMRENRATLHDYLADKPHLAARYKAGTYDPFEM